jgi:hypothetical protein
MNKKVFVSMLTLCIVFLAGLYIAKIFFPQEFMMSIQNERIVKIGTYIDNNKWLYYICCGITSYLTYYLYCCACSHRLTLKWEEHLMIFGVVVLSRAVNFYDENLATALSVTSFLFLPALMNGYLKTSAIVYTIHGFAQVLSLGIRNLPMYLHSINFITTFCFGIECYLWLALSYIIFNYKKKEVE